MILRFNHNEATMKVKALLMSFVLLVPFCSTAAEEKPGYVRIPLAEYERLAEASRTEKKTPREAPAQYALAKAEIEARVSVDKNRALADVSADIAIQVLDDDWVLVPILPGSSAVASASVDNKEADLVAKPDGLYWGVKAAGAHRMHLTYKLDATANDGAFVLAIPLPEAASKVFTVTLPGENVEAALLPSAGTTRVNQGGETVLRASIPPSKGVQLSWKKPASAGDVISRAAYHGVLEEQALHFTAQLTAHLGEDEPVNLQLLPSTQVLEALIIDGKPAPVRTENGFFVAELRGAGDHQLLLGFQAAVPGDLNPPRVIINVPETPISEFEVVLPGKKELEVLPLSSVKRREDSDKTVCSFNLPMTNRVGLSWKEAVPEEGEQDVRLNSSLYHNAYAEEGVLFMHALIVNEVTHGETSTFDFEAPADVQINKLTSSAEGLSDWRIAKTEDAKKVRVTAFFDRQLKDDFSIDVYYDKSINGDAPFDIPFLYALNVHRQRGMVAFAAGKDLTLQAEHEERATRVGENQLPPFVRSAINKTIAHTFKYTDTQPLIRARAVKPERTQGRYDALASTLLSLSDVTLRGSTTIELNVKSGAISELDLELPSAVNLLSLTAPSLRQQQVNDESGKQRVNIQFTQDMEGQFRIEAVYEKILPENEAQVVVPALSVKGAEIEQGRLGVEALSTVEVQPAKASQLSSIEPSELPQQLVMKTTNPILLAYKYVRSETPFELALGVTRHRQVETQSAIIDSAEYQTLYSRDGLAVTAAKFLVRNSRQQFLRIVLPPDSKVWSVFVDGRPEKPALAENSKQDSTVLIKIINSAEAFPVSVVYQTPVPGIGTLGSVYSALPAPDMIVTQTRWRIYLPAGLHYGEPRTNMRYQPDVTGLRATGDLRAKDFALLTASASRALEITVPAEGVVYTFEKLYANQSQQVPYVSIAYRSVLNAPVEYLFGFLPAIAFWAGLLLAVIRPQLLKAGLIVSLLGLLAFGLLFHFEVDPGAALHASAAVLLLALVYLRRRRVCADTGQKETTAV